MTFILDDNRDSLWRYYINSYYNYISNKNNIINKIYNSIINKDFKLKIKFFIIIIKILY